MFGLLIALENVGFWAGQGGLLGVLRADSWGLSEEFYFTSYQLWLGITMSSSRYDLRWVVSLASPSWCPAPFLPCAGTSPWQFGQMVEGADLPENYLLVKVT